MPEVGDEPVRPFIDVRERHYLIHNPTRHEDGDPPITAIGTTSIVFCVGMYCELDEINCFIWHAFGRPMNGKGQAFHYSEIETTEDFKKISKRHEQWLTDKLGTATDRARETLILATTEYNDENWGIIHGMLSWAGIADHTGWVRQNMRCAAAFIVKDPGRSRSVDYFFPLHAIDDDHPANMCWGWEGFVRGACDDLETIEAVGEVEVEQMYHQRGEVLASGARALAHNSGSRTNGEEKVNNCESDVGPESEIRRRSGKLRIFRPSIGLRRGRSLLSLLKNESKLPSSGQHIEPRLPDSSPSSSIVDSSARCRNTPQTQSSATSRSLMQPNDEGTGQSPLRITEDTKSEAQHGKEEAQGDVDKDPVKAWQRTWVLGYGPKPPWRPPGQC